MRTTRGPVCVSIVSARGVEALIVPEKSGGSDSAAMLGGLEVDGRPGSRESVEGSSLDEGPAINEYPTRSSTTVRVTPPIKCSQRFSTGLWKGALSFAIVSP